MKVRLYKEFNNILSDLISILKTRKNYIYSEFDEVDPFDYNLSFTSIISKNTVDKIVDNNLCTLCLKRVSYKTIPFEKKIPNQKTLILIHNPFLDVKDQYFQNSKVNDLFKKIINKTLDIEVDNFLVREVLRCHFGDKNTNSSEWLDNCKQHLQNDIEKYQIQNIIIIGNAVRLLFKENQEIKERAYKISTFMNLPCIISPGPEKIIYMQNKNYTSEKITEEKNKIIKSLSIFREKLLKT